MHALLNDVHADYQRQQLVAAARVCHSQQPDLAITQHAVRPSALQAESHRLQQSALKLDCTYVDCTYACKTLEVFMGQQMHSDLT